MSQEETRVCKACNHEKPITAFQKVAGKLHTYRRLCRSCRWQGEKKRVSYQELADKKLVKKQLSRLNPERRAYHICEDSSRYDRKFGGAEHDLTVEWVDEQISKPCSYCKQQLSKLDMTLDRIDNNIGHVKINLVPACKRCNYFRRDMPYEAWMILAKNMPKIAKLHLLDGWSAGAGLRGVRKTIHENNLNQPTSILERTS